MTINEMQLQFAQKLDDPLREILRGLSHSLPEDYALQVFLLDDKGKKSRKKKSNAAANNWSPESGKIEIRFVRQAKKPLRPEISQTQESAPNPRPQAVRANASPAATYVHPAEAELLQALDRAESKPGWNFVPLKKFRDEILPLERCPSMRTTVEQHNILRSAIDKRFILTAKVQNPKSPQFPVTTIRLNRLMHEVKAALGQAGDADSDFRPIEIGGEPLSTTILRERR